MRCTSLWSWNCYAFEKILPQALPCHSGANAAARSVVVSECFFWVLSEIDSKHTDMKNVYNKVWAEFQAKISKQSSWRFHLKQLCLTTRMSVQKLCVLS